jgi:hypothetical protein
MTEKSDHKNGMQADEVSLSEIRFELRSKSFSAEVVILGTIRTTEDPTMAAKLCVNAIFVHAS